MARHSLPWIRFPLGLASPPGRRGLQLRPSQAAGELRISGKGGGRGQSPCPERQIGG